MTLLFIFCFENEYWKLKYEPLFHIKLKNQKGDTTGHLILCYVARLPVSRVATPRTGVGWGCDNHRGSGAVLPTGAVLLNIGSIPYQSTKTRTAETRPGGNAVGGAKGEL